MNLKLKRKSLIIFDGIPVLNNLKATFYGFDKRKENDIENLWKLFSSALKLSDADTEENRAAFSKWYDIVHEQLCIRWNLTMALYWIRPYYFINLDSRNRWYITNIENMPSEFVESVKPKLNKLPNAADYLFIMDACRSAMETVIMNIRISRSFHTMPGKFPNR